MEQLNITNLVDVPLKIRVCYYVAFAA